MEKLDFIKIKNFYFKTYHQKDKRQPKRIYVRKCLQIIYLMRDLYILIYNSYISVIERKTNQLKNEKNKLKSKSPKKDM